MTHAGLTEQEITALPDQTRVYESVGRMFILSNKYVIKLELFVNKFSKFNFSHSTTVGAGWNTERIWYSNGSPLLFSNGIRFSNGVPFEQNGRILYTYLC